MRKFQGFPQGKVQGTWLPASFFTDLLPLIDDVSELKVVLFCVWALQQQEGEYRYLLRRDFINDEPLMQGLAVIDPNAETDVLLDAALDRACQREALLSAQLMLNDEPERLYVANTARGRAVIDQIATGEWRPTADRRVEILPPRPNIYRLYEENIGALTPMIADALKSAEREYPAGWVADAIQAAVENNARSLKFIEAVLERRLREGKYRETTSESARRDTEWFTSGKFADFIDK